MSPRPDGPAVADPPPPARAPWPPGRLLLAVAVGGALGAVARWALGTWFPAGSGVDVTTLAINVSGCLLLAALPGWSRVRDVEWLRVLLGPGVLGGYTTFSAVSEQTRAHLAADETVAAVLTLLGTLAACLAAVAVGSRLARRRSDVVGAQEPSEEPR